MKIFIVLLITLLFSANGIAQNWYTYAGSNQKNGLTELMGPVSATTPYWTVNSSTSAVWGNAVYTFGDKFATARITFSPSYRGKIELRSLTNGALIWEKTVADTAIMYVVGFTEDAVYACDYKGHRLYAFTVDSGNVKWSIASDMFPGNTGICFAEDGDPVIFGKRLDRKTGIPKWTYNYIIPVGPDGGFVLNGNTYYHWTGSIVTPKKLIAVNLTTGALKYESTSLPGDGDQENDLVIGPDGTIYIARDGGALHAFTDNGTGFAQKWSMSPAVLVKSFGPNNVLYCANINNGSTNGRLMRVNGTTGTVIDSVSTFIPAVYVTVGYDSTVYVATGEAGNGRYFAFTPDLQTVKWQLNVPYNYYGGCPLGKEGMFIITGSGTEITAYKPVLNRKPTADFRSGGRDITTAQALNFFDQSSYAPTSWQWTFDGGTPSTSTSQNPAGISYTTPGVYQVKLVASNSYGTDTIIRSQYVHVTSGVGISNNGETVSDYKLFQNYPNPFNNETVINYQLSIKANVRIIVYDIRGSEIDVLINKTQNQGKYNIIYNAGKLPSGIYFYKLFVDNRTADVKKMILIK
ncbi:MAG: PKD domain-containing protein [Ignavibacteria bacterium]|nr:PKD domain-containing protein [Ignavibacteria bacterium]